MEFYNLYSLIVLALLIVILTKVNSFIKSSKESVKSIEDKIIKLQKLFESHQSSISETAIKPEESTWQKIIPSVEPEIENFPIEEEIHEEIVHQEISHEKISMDLEHEYLFGEEENSDASEELLETVHFSNDQHSVQSVPEKVENKVFVEPKKPWLQKFKEENPDIEKFIGENLINKIGILILVLGVSFFVKFAIDKNWISETDRVGIGVLAGAIVLGVAHRLKTNYKAFSSVFVAGAFAIFYFTIAIAFQEYHLFNQTVAFIIMVVITIFSSFISISYNRQELGVMTLIAGFSVPFMVSTGDGNYIVLFSYIAILNIGMLLISYFKKWNIVNVLSFVLTCVLYIGWWYKVNYSTPVPHRGAFIFATLFFLIFSIATVINNLRSSGTFSKIQYALIIANSFFYFGIGLSIIDNAELQLKGVFTVALAVYNLIYATVLYRKFKLNKNAVYLLIGLTLTFATLTIPIQFSGNYITIFWACEAVLLFWLAQKSKIEAFRWSAIIVQILMLFSLMMDWQIAYDQQVDTKESVHSIFITGLVALVSLFYTYYLLRKETEITKFFSLEFNPKLYQKVLFVVTLLVGYFVGILETHYQADLHSSRSSEVISFTAGFHYLFSIILIYFLLKKNSDILKKFAVLLGIINVFLYMCYFGNLPLQDFSRKFLAPSNNTIVDLLHLVILLSIGYFIFLLVKSTLQKPIFKKFNSKYSLWILSFVVVFILSQELIIQGVLLNSDHGLLKNDLSYYTTQIVKVGFPILWGVISFALLIIGIKKDWKQLRIIALSLLGITIIKLFLFDINDASETGKIIAFILLGVLILIISFVYQKLKKLVVDESKKNKDEEVE